MASERDLDSAKLGQGYKTAQGFVDDLAKSIPMQTGRQGENDQIAYILEKISGILDIIVDGVTPVSEILLFNQFIQHDLVVPDGLDGLTASRGVDPGFNVDIIAGSILHFIGDNPNITSVRASNTMKVVDSASAIILAIEHNGKAIRYTGAGDTFTMPNSNAEGWQVGDSVTFFNEGTGPINIIGDAGVVFVGGGTSLQSNGTCGMMIMTSPDSWNAVGGFV